MQKKYRIILLSAFSVQEWKDSMLFKPEHMHMETYRSGHNGAHSKCVSPLPGSRVRIPPSPEFKGTKKDILQKSPIKSGFFALLEHPKNRCSQKMSKAEKRQIRTSRCLLTIMTDRAPSSTMIRRISAANKCTNAASGGTTTCGCKWY